jgi:hypothetical protein
MPTPELAPNTSTVCPGTHGGEADQHVPRGHEHERDAGRLIEIEPGGNGNHAGGGHGDQLAVAAIDAIAEHGELAALVLNSRDALYAVSAKVHGSDQDALADRKPGDIFADLSDLSGDVAAEDVRQFHARQTLAHPHVEMIERAGFHPHQHLILARLRVRDVFVRQNFRATELMNANGSHKASLLRSNSGPSHKRTAWRDWHCLNITFSGSGPL